MHGPPNIAALLHDGLAHQRAARLDAAENCYRAFLAFQPAHPDALVNLGLVLLRTDRPAAAEPCLRAAIRADPLAADAHANLGAALLRLGRHAEAAEELRAALRLQPDMAAAHSALGLALAALGDLVAAVECTRRALALRPDDAAGWNNLGTLLCDLGRFGEAEAALRQALTLAPEHADAASNLGNALLASGRLAEAEASYRTALRLDPLHADAHYNLGTTHLLAGRLAAGWQGFEWRWRRRGFAPPRDFPQPQWHGEPTAGVLLLHAEQGLGDAIQMARFIPAIAAHTRVVLEAPAPLLRLFAGLDGVETLIRRGDPLPDFDVHCPLMSLPLALGIDTLANIPAAVPYLHPAPADVAAWRRRLAPLPPLRIGLCWAGNPGYAADRRRSIPPALLAALDGIDGVAFVSLQKDRDPPTAPHLHDWTADLHDLADTAALVAAFDCVISVDTAIAHLAGALGKPVWLLNRSDPCWRWLRARDDSPWYPTLRQFRQTRAGEWETVLQDVKEAIKARRGLCPSTPVKAEP